MTAGALDRGREAFLRGAWAEAHADWDPHNLFCVNRNIPPAPARR